uniref:Uncharacterized protein n=1 Tax=Lepeophtheirus salmonis TaxID=72036 RepID=A0A0K2TZ79_LEPSM
MGVLANAFRWVFKLLHTYLVTSLFFSLYDRGRVTFF